MKFLKTGNKFVNMDVIYSLESGIYEGGRAFVVMMHLKGEVASVGPYLMAGLKFHPDLYAKVNQLAEDWIASSLDNYSSKSVMSLDELRVKIQALVKSLEEDHAKVVKKQQEEAQKAGPSGLSKNQVGPANLKEIKE